MTSKSNFDKQQVSNVFQLMMDARNKVIGSNSPGKDDRTETNVLRDQNKELLAKRKIKFEAWAAEKGGLKRKLKEEAIDNQIKEGLDKRAKRLKKLISNHNKKTDKLVEDSHSEVQAAEKHVKSKRSSRKIDCSNSKNSEVLKILKDDKEQTTPIISNKLKLKNRDSKSPISNTDYEFLSKLSPSLKKSENLLCYFDKVSPEVNKSTVSSTPASRKAHLKSPKWKIRIATPMRNDEYKNASIPSDDDDVQILDWGNLHKNNKTTVPKTNLPSLNCKSNKLQNNLEAHSSSGSSNKQKLNICSEEIVIFPSVSHVYQKCLNSKAWKLPINTTMGSFHNRNDGENIANDLLLHNLPLGSFTSCKRCHIRNDTKTNNLSQNMFNDNLLAVLEKKYPDFPVYKTYQSIKNKYLKIQDENHNINDKAVITKTRKKKSKATKSPLQTKNILVKDMEIKNTLWTDTFFPDNSEEFFNIDENGVNLKKWLIQWKNLNNMKLKKHYDSDGTSNSDSEFQNSDTESINSNLKSLGNTCILLGPCGSGKTSTLYMLAHELGYNVIELNASSKRTGKIAFTKLQEATQSHGVRSNDNKLIYFTDKSKDVKKKLKNNSVNNLPTVNSVEENSKSKNLSLILIEDVDVVFEEDDGLISVLLQMVQTSKRPIVFTCCDENNPNVKKFTNDNLVFRFKPANSLNMSIWLQILCFVNNVSVDQQEIHQLLQSFNGDARKVTHQLQYWALSKGNSKDTLRNKKNNINSSISSIDIVENLSLPNEKVDIYKSNNLLCACTNEFYQTDCHMYTYENLWYYMSLSKYLIKSQSNEIAQTNGNGNIDDKGYRFLINILDTTLHIGAFSNIISTLQLKDSPIHTSTENFKNYFLSNVYFNLELDPHKDDGSEIHYKR